MMGKDHTIFAVADGMVKFDKSATRARICIVPVEEVAEDAPKVETRKTRKYAKCVPAESSTDSAGAGGAARRADAPLRLCGALTPHVVCAILTRPPPFLSAHRFPPRNSALAAASLSR